MNKIILNKPLMILLYGFPGAGKTHFARQLSESLDMAHLHGDRIRYELFEQPKYDKKENEIVDHLMQYMGEEFLKAGVSVIYDNNATRLLERRTLRDLARRVHAQQVLIWLQIDPESALVRIGNRDRRKNDDKFAVDYDKSSFESVIQHMQNPVHEDYVVISGKHTFNTQRSAVIKKLYEQGIVNADNASNNVVKPGMVNLVPSHVAGRVDLSRRNIIIR